MKQDTGNKKQYLIKQIQIKKTNVSTQPYSYAFLEKVHKKVNNKPNINKKNGAKNIKLILK